METDRIATYTIRYQIGSGGMSTVYYAVNSLNDPFAIKVLNADLTHHDVIRKRFRNEMEALKSLRNIEQICQIKDYYEDDHQMAIVMEYLTGTDLLGYIRRNGPVAPSLLVKWMQELLPAFATCHARKIVHRDVKPSNFFLADDGKLKILDFGIAKALDQSENQLNSMALGLTSIQEVIGSPMYMSPEQVRGLGQIDHRSDIYSLGVTIHTLLVGRNPYQGLSTTSNYDVQEAVVKMPLPPLTGSVAAFDPVIQKATQKEPNSRYQSVSELLDALNLVRPTSQTAPNTTHEVQTKVVRPHPISSHRLQDSSSGMPPAKPVPVDRKARSRSVRLALLVGLLGVMTGAGIYIYGVILPPASESAELADSLARASQRPTNSDPEPTISETPEKSDPVQTSTGSRVSFLARQAADQLTHLDRFPADQHSALFAAARTAFADLRQQPVGGPGLDSLYMLCATEGEKAKTAYERTRSEGSRQYALEWYRTAYVMKPYPALQARIANLQSAHLPVQPAKIGSKAVKKRKSTKRPSSAFVLDSEVN